MLLTNTVFLNTTSGSRKLPEYFIFASHDKLKTILVNFCSFFELEGRRTRLFQIENNTKAKHNRFHAGPPAWIEWKFTFMLRLF